MGWKLILIPLDWIIPILDIAFCGIHNAYNGIIGYW